MFKCFLGLISILVFSSFAFCNEKDFYHYNREVEVPEPMYIDLVRSLNSEKGEWEINSLFADYNKKSGDLEWAPEVEYVFLDGQAVEFEFPGQGDRFKKYKFAYQRTITSLKKRNSLHGFQVIYEIDKNLNDGQSSLYHIFAQRFNKKFSMISLAGLKLSTDDISQKSYALNHTTFYNYTNEVDFGIEINLESAELDNKMFQIIPQIHLALNRGIKIQYGFGTARINNENGLVTSFRVIKEFNK